MTEHQVVVVLDITAPDRIAAARCAVGILNGTRGWYSLPEGQATDTQLQSWWFPEADLKPVDRNDNGAFHLVEDACAT